MFIPVSIKYPLEWLLVFVLLLTAKLIEWYKPPFIRAVQLTDPTINFPFIAKQQYSDLKLFSAAVFLPFFCICVYNSTWLALNGWRNAKQFYVWHMSLLSFGFAVALNGISTEFLKTLIGKPRPDFVARCGPDRTPKGALTETAIIVDPLRVCTRPYGDAVFLDGFKSTPSGHSSFALCGLVWLTLYAYGQSRVLHGSSKASQLLLTLPLWFAVQICISRTQDYRHHFKDILLGGLLGGLVGAGTYYWFFPSVTSEKCNEPKTSGPPVDWCKEPQNIV